ncbi:MAG: hypothetical protein RIF33_10750 [Cyclobacteriaceae bacterium]
MRSILLVGLILLQCQLILGQDEAAQEMSSTAEVHQDLDGKVFHWGYSNLGGGPASFRVLIKNEKLHFEGVAGVVKGAIGTNTPQFSKIDEGVYFITWQASHGIESLVINLNTMKVNGHLQFGDELSAIGGDITCNGLMEECDAPKLKEIE